MCSGMERVQKASGRRRPRLAIGLALLLCGAHSAPGAAAGLGNQKIVLPGFAPIEQTGSESGSASAATSGTRASCRSRSTVAAGC